MSRIRLLLITALFLASTPVFAQDSLNISSVSTFMNYWGEPASIAVVGDIAYVGVLNHGLAVLDISNPTAPREIRTVIPAKDVYGLQINQNFLYAACHTDGLLVLDISTPESPQYLNTVTPEAYPHELWMEQGYLLCKGMHSWSGIGNGGYSLPFYVYDLTDPSCPVEIDHIPYETSRQNPCEWMDATFLDSTTLLHGEGYWASVYSLSEDGFVSLGEWPARFYSNTMAAMDTFLFIQEDGYLQVISVSDRQNPELITVVENEGYCDRMRVSGDTLVVANFGYSPYVGISIFDISDPTNLQRICNFEMAEHINDYAIQNDTLFTVRHINNGTDRMAIWAHNDQNEFTFLGEYSDPGGALALAAYDTLLYVAKGINGCSIVSLADPEHPQIINEIQPPVQDTECIFVKIEDDYLFLLTSLDSNGYLHIYTLTQPDAPEFQCSLTININNALQTLDYCSFNGDSLLAVMKYNGESYVSILNIADPQNPEFCSTIPGLGFGIVEGNRFYNAAYGIRIWDISDPYTPEQINVYADEFYGDPVVYHGILFETGCWAFSEPAFQIFDLRDPSNPTRIYRRYHTYLGIRGMWSHFLLTTEYDTTGTYHRIVIKDVFQPSAPHNSGSYRSPYIMSELEVVGENYLVGAARSNSTPYRYVQVFEAGEALGVEEDPVSDGVMPSGFAIESIYPNPFNSATTIRYTLPETGDVRVGVYTVTGQEVFSQTLSGRNSGAHLWSWAGSGSDGSTLASGMYFIRMEWEGQTQAVKVLLLK